MSTHDNAKPAGPRRVVGILRCLTCGKSSDCLPEDALRYSRSR